MKKRYLPFIVLGFAIFAWNCSESSSSGPSENPLPTTAELPYYLGGFTIDPATGKVSDANGSVVGQLNADGTVVSSVDGSVIFAADTTVLPSISSAGFLINKNGVVTDLNENVIGSLGADGATITKEDGSIVDLNGNEIQPSDKPLSSNGFIESSSSVAADPEATLVAPSVVGNFYSDMTVRDANGNVVGTFDATTGYVKLNNGSVVDLEGKVISAPASSSSTVSSSSVEQPQMSSSSENEQQVEVKGDLTISGSLTQTVAQGQKISQVSVSNLKAQPSRQSWNAWFISDNDLKYDASAKTFTINGTVPESFQIGEVTETWIIDGTPVALTLNVTAKGGSTQPQSSSSVKSSSSQQQQKSSSSVARSSSSAAKSSSSTTTGGDTGLKYVAGGASGSGWATRYWDCCKPSCSWTNNAGAGNEARLCNANGSTRITDLNATSVCEGGNASTCKSQMPIIVNDNLAYAFAAVPASNGGQCGHCYALTFDGTGKYETKDPHQGLKGKVLVVMASNVGADVEQGQFDVMIPGGGVGKYNGCANMGWGAMGQQYGGLLSDCESEVGYSKSGATLTNARKQCLTQKCNSTFANDPVAKEGCLFLATWMNAAGNPNHTYREVECPAALKAQY